MRMLDLFAGRLGWGKEFLARGWRVVAIDLVVPEEIPDGVEFIAADIMDCSWERGALKVWARGCPVAGEMWIKDVDFICASSPCEQFSVHGMKHFHPTPKYPEMGIKLFNHARAMCEAARVPYVMENVKPAQKFVGHANARCGSFYLWGNGIPPLLPQGIRKGATQMRRDGRYKRHGGVDELMYGEKKERARALATIPPELASCVADYAERITCAAM